MTQRARLLTVATFAALGLMTLATCAEDGDRTLDSVCNDWCSHRLSCDAESDLEACKGGCLNMLNAKDYYGASCLDAAMDRLECQNGLACEMINDANACQDDADREAEVCVD